MYKRTLGFLLAATLALALIASCGGGGATTSKTTTKATTTTPVTTTRPTTTTSAAVTTTSAVPTTTSKPPTSTGVDLQAILGLAAGVTSVKYDMVMSGAGVPANTTTVWMKQKNMRMETKEGGQTIVIIVNSATKTYVMYTLPDKTGFTLPYQEEESAIDEVADIMSYSPKVLGTETVDGKVCTVIEYTYSEGANQAKAKAWIWNQHGFPIKMEITTSQGTMTILYQNIVIGDISDNMFKVPSDVTIMSGLPTAFPGM